MSRAVTLAAPAQAMAATRATVSSQACSCLLCPAMSPLEACLLQGKHACMLIMQLFLKYSFHMRSLSACVQLLLHSYGLCVLGVVCARARQG